MRLLRRADGRALVCLYLMASFAAAGALSQGKRDDPNAALSAPSPTATPLPPLPTDYGGAFDPLPLTRTSTRRTSSTSSLVKPTGKPGSALFNATLPEGQLPLEPQITPGWAVAGTLLLGTGVIHALFGIRMKRVHTFFSAGFLASLGTTVLILYLMTPPASLAVQGAFVVAAVCTGAALGGLAVLFRDLAECLGCLLGGFCISMWLLTLHPDGLVTGASGKIAFIAVFSFTGFGLYFSRWTRTYSLIACISFSGATAVVLGIDCFSRAGLKEFWAYIWSLNDKLFPDGTVTYPLTRGIRVELAVTVLFFIVGIVSQLKLWRLIKDRRNKGRDDSSDGDMVLPDEEENVGRQVEEMTNRERREWERVYGDSGSVPAGSHTAVDEMESEKHVHDSKRTSATSTTDPADFLPEGEVHGEPSEKRISRHTIMATDDGDGRVMVRVVEDDVPGPEAAHDLPESRADVAGSPGPSVIPTTRRSSKTGQEPEVIPLPFKIPVPVRKRERPSAAASAEDDDKSSVVAVADEIEGTVDLAPSVLAREAELKAERTSGMPTGPEHFRSGLVPRSVGGKLEDGMAVERYEPLVPLVSSTRIDSDSIVATLDDANDSGDAETAVLDWSPRLPEGNPRGSLDGAGQEGAENAEQLEAVASSAAVANAAGSVVDTSAPETLDQPKRDESRSTSTRPDSVVGVEKPRLGDSEVVAPVHSAPLNEQAALSSKGAGSTESFHTVVARLTRLNLPPALPEVALTYRTNEWAKHLSIAEAPEPDVLQIPEPVADVPDEQPAHLDVVGLQQTAETGAPAPVAPRAPSAMSNYPQQGAMRSVSRASLSGSEVGLGVQSGLDSQSGHKPGAYRSTSAMMSQRNSVVLAEPIAEEDAANRGTDGAHEVQPTNVIALHRLSSGSASTPNLLSDGPAQGPQPASRPPTLIGMREMLLRSRASGSFALVGNDVVHIPSDPSAIRRPPSDGGSIRNYATSPAGQARSSGDFDPDDVPLSHRRAMFRQSSHSLTGVPTQALNPPTATADTANFDSHQPARHSGVSEAVRQAQLANFRNSVAADLRTAPLPPPPLSTIRRLSSGVLSGPLIAAATSNPPAGDPIASASANPITTIPTAAGIGLPTMPSSIATATLPATAGGGAGLGTAAAAAAGGGAVPEHRSDVLRSIELQRSILLGQKEAEAQRRGLEAAERERYQREFEERMRSGALMGAHRDAMRKLQGGVKG